MQPIGAVPKNLAQVGANLSSTLMQEGENNLQCDGKTIQIDDHADAVIDDASNDTAGGNGLGNRRRRRRNRRGNDDGDDDIEEPSVASDPTLFAQIKS